MGLVLVDQDGTIADFERALLDAFRAKYPDAPFIDVADRREVSARRQYGPEWGPAVDAIMKAEGFYLSLPVITGAPRALEEMLEAGHEVFVCTSPLSGTRWCMPEKLAWVEQHLGESWVDRVIITKDKTLVGDPHRRCILVDDRPGVNGVLGSADVLEDLLLLGALDGKVVIGSMNRGGLADTVFEIDDRFTGYDAAAVGRMGFDGGKMLMRIDPDDPASAATAITSSVHSSSA